MIRHALLTMILGASAPALASKSTSHEQAELDAIRDTPADEMMHMAPEDIERRMRAARALDQTALAARNTAHKAIPNDSEVIPLLTAQYAGAVDRLVKERQDREVCAGKLMAVESRLEESLAANRKPSTGDQYVWTAFAALAGAALGWFMRTLLFRKPREEELV